MISCHVRYRIDPERLDAFEAYARAWMSLVNSRGGTHHGYHVPEDGSNNVAVALFTFPSPEAFEAYVRWRKHDPGCEAAYAIARSAGCILDYEWQLMRPIEPAGD